MGKNGLKQIASQADPEPPQGLQSIYIIGFAKGCSLSGKRTGGRNPKWLFICSTSCDHSLFGSALCCVYSLVFVQKSDEKQVTVNPCYLVSIKSYVRTNIYSFIATELKKKLLPSTFRGGLKRLSFQHSSTRANIPLNMFFHLLEGIVFIYL